MRSGESEAAEVIWLLIARQHTRRLDDLEQSRLTLIGEVNTVKSV
jgi:hypothetical protein